MKTVKHYKSFDIGAISKAIDNDVQELMDSRYQRIYNSLNNNSAKDNLLKSFIQNGCKAIAYARVIGDLQALLTIAVMELKHLETVNSQHAPIPSK